MGLNLDGKTVWLRFKKACETIRAKYDGKRAEYAIDGLITKQFGEDFTRDALKKLVLAGEWYKLALQAQRAQHSRALELKSYEESVNILLDTWTTDYRPETKGTAKTHNDEEAVPFM